LALFQFDKSKRSFVYRRDVWEIHDTATKRTCRVVRLLHWRMQLPDNRAQRYEILSDESWVCWCAVSRALPCVTASNCLSPVLCSNLSLQAEWEKTFTIFSQCGEALPFKAVSSERNQVSQFGNSQVQRWALEVKQQHCVLKLRVRNGLLSACCLLCSF